MHAIGVGFYVGAGIPKGPRVNTFVECGCCGAWHRADFNGDCREDSERHYDIPDDARVIYLDDEDNDEEEYSLDKLGRVCDLLFNHPQRDEYDLAAIDLIQGVLDEHGDI